MLKNILLALKLFILVSCFSTAASAAPPTLRLDYYHTGNAAQEMFSLDRVILEPLAWPGNPQKAIDDSNLGKYSFEVIDRKTNRVVYSRLRFRLRRMGDDRRSKKHKSHFS